MTRRIVTTREHDLERAMLAGLADECKRLAEAIAGGQVVKVDIRGKEYWVLGAGTHDRGRHPAVVLHEVNETGIRTQDGTVVKGKNDEVWAKLLESAGIPRNEAFLPPGDRRLVLPGRGKA